MPEAIGHDAKVRILANQVFGFWPLHTRSRPLARDAHPRTLVPSPHADVSVISQHGPDGGVPPASVALVPFAAVMRSRDALLVEPRSDCLRAGSRHGLLKNAHHDRRFVGIDPRNLPGMLRVRRIRLGDGSVPVGLAAGVESPQSPAFQPAVRLPAVVLEELVVDESLHPEEEARPLGVTGDPRAAVDHAYPKDRHLLEDDAPGGSEIAGQAAQIVDEHGFETSSGTLRSSPFMPTTSHTHLRPPANFPHVLGARSKEGGPRRQIGAIISNRSLSSLSSDICARELSIQRY
jgi:hypothetical protein